MHISVARIGDQKATPIGQLLAPGFVTILSL